MTREKKGKLQEFRKKKENPGVFFNIIFKKEKLQSPFLPLFIPREKKQTKKLFFL